MQNEESTALHQRMIEGMRIRGMAERTKAASIRAFKDVAAMGRLILDVQLLLARAKPLPADEMPALYLPVVA
jgi:hypothetical protein